MPRTIRFHLDESCDPRIAAGLRLHAVDVTTTADAGLLHASDQEQIAFAVDSERVIITQDADFLRLDAAQVGHPGILYFKPRTRTVGQVVRWATLIWEVMEPAEMRDRVEYL